MKKYLSLFAFAMVAVFSLAFVSCGDDDEDDDYEPSVKGSQLVINGKTYNVPFNNQIGVIWSTPPVGSVIQFCTDKNGKLNYDDIYTFGFPAGDGENYWEPKIGMDISKLEWCFMGDIIHSFTLTDNDDRDCDYISGSLIIVEINKSQESITLKFNDLKMGNGKVSYTFNGKIKLPLDFI